MRGNVKKRGNERRRKRARRETDRKGKEHGSKFESTSDGRIELYVSVLSLGPNGVRSTVEGRRDRSDKTTAEASLRGVEMEVTISFG